MREKRLKYIPSQIKSRLQHLWNFKVFRYSLIIHLFYFLLSIYLTLIFFPEKNDFLVYYKVGKVFLTNPVELYNPTNYNWPFRYLPLSVFLFVPYSLMDFNLAFTLFNISNIIVNYFISILLFRLIKLTMYKDQKENEKKIIKYICFYLICLPQVFNYILGQINLYVTILILISLYYFVKNSSFKANIIAGFLLGTSILIKPTTIFMIPFLIIISYNTMTHKLNFNIGKSIARFLGVLSPISLNLLMFFIIPGLLEGFININLTGTDTLIPNHSFSITKIISNLLIFIGINPTSINVLTLFLIVSIILGVIGFFVFILNKVKEFSIIYGYIIALLIMLLAYFDSWDHHLLNLIPLLIIVIFLNPKNSDIVKKYIKSSFFFFCFLDLAFMGLFWILNPDPSNLMFPFNFIPTIFLVYLFYGILKICTNKQ